MNLKTLGQIGKITDAMSLGARKALKGALANGMSAETLNQFHLVAKRFESLTSEEKAVVLASLDAPAPVAAPAAPAAAPV